MRSTLDGGVLSLDRESTVEGDDARVDVRQIDATLWECTACGEQVEVPRGQRPIAMVVTLSSKPRERVVSVREEIIHRCTLGEDYAESDMWATS
jgi:hypothetical protein